MTLKKFGALLLAGAMMTGTIGVMSPTQVKAVTSANTYTMKVPADVNIKNPGWNSLGKIEITGTVNTGKKVTVTAETTNHFALKSGENSVSYTMKTEEDGSAQTSFEFDAASINTEGGASQAIGVDVGDLAETPAGTYTDTIQFTGKMSEASEALLWEEADGLFIELEDGTYNYSVSLQNIGSVKNNNNNAPCQKHNKADGKYHENDESALFDLKIDGNVFTLTSKDAKADFDITINFSKKEECKITRNSETYKLLSVMHRDSRTGRAYFLVNNFPE